MDQPHTIADQSRRENGSYPISIAATSTAVPSNELKVEEVRKYLDIVFPMSEARRGTMLEVIENAQIERRYTVFPVEYIVQPRPLEQTSKEYAEHSVCLGRRVAAQCLQRAGITPQDVDLLITVSCTGIMIPSLDAHLINHLGFRSDVRRLPITELGCAAGSAALGRAWDFLRGVHEGNVLIVAVELPSLTFQARNFSPANLISSVLFGDGAAAALVTKRPENGHRGGPKILATQSHLFPDTIEAMGFELKESGLNIVLSKDVPQLIRDHIRQLVDCFLSKNGLKQGDLSAFVLHPGGQKLLQFVEEELGLAREYTQFSWEVLRKVGNLSSASVLFVLQETLERTKLAAGSKGLLAAFGPGFSAEMLLLEWA